MPDSDTPLTALVARAQSARKRGNLSEAEAILREALDRDTSNPAAFSELHAILRDAGRMQEALAAIDTAVRLSPDNPALIFMRAQTLEGMGHLSAALDAAKQCQALEPNWMAAMALEASVLRQMGYGEKAVDTFKSLLDEESLDPGIHGKLLLALHADPRATLKTLMAEAHKAWLGSASIAANRVTTRSEQDRKLKVAFVSGDFREHPVGYFMEGVLAAHDRSGFEIHLVTTVAGTDVRTEKMKSLAQGWHAVAGLDDEEAAALLRSLNIDIAIDLSGWTRGHRLGLFQHRIAPVQMTWLGYSGTTGLNAMDYILCDETVLPDEHETYYSEAPLRLPGSYLSLVPPNDLLPDLGPRPALMQNRIIFGSFNALAKLTEEVISTWADILLKVDGSKLLLRARQLGDDGVKADLASRFLSRGIESSRLILEGNNTRKGMLAGYRKLDIALDPFPYGGTTTTCEALCMGVPVITLKGERWVGLVGASLLQTVDHPELIANDRAEYVQKAVELALDMPRLTALRSGLSKEVLASPLCDTVAFTRQLEDALRSSWTSWCDKQTASPH